MALGRMAGAKQTRLQRAGFCHTPHLAWQAWDGSTTQGVSEMAMVREELVEGPDAVVLPFPNRAVGRLRPDSARRRAVAGRRIVLGVMVLLLTAALVLATGPGGVAPASRSGAPARVTIGAGETVWDLAERYAPDGIDRRAYVDAILELNGLQGAPLAGERLKLPK